MAAPGPRAHRRSDPRRDLAERSKELDCLRGITALFGNTERPLERTLEEAAALVVKGWQDPRRACARIRLLGCDIRTRGYDHCVRRMSHAISVGARVAGRIEVAYPSGAARSLSPVFLPSETRLLHAVAVLLGTAVELAQARDSLRRQAAQLRQRRAALQRKNVALRELLSLQEREERLRSRGLRAHVEGVVLPIVARLRRAALTPAERDRSLELLEERVRAIGSPRSGTGVSGLAGRLSPREVEIADLVRAGVGSKEIGAMLGISETTVERHRHNIRRKLGVTDGSVNLASYLSGL